VLWLSSLLLLLAAASPALSAERLNRVVELLEQNQPPLGIFASEIDPRAAAALASAPLDFIIIDMEHTPYDVTRLQSYLLGMIDKRRIASTGKLQPAVTPIVRLPANGREHVEFMIKQVLDLGVFGVVVPHVGSREDALAAVRAMRYAQEENARDREPEGHRGVGYGWAARYWGIAPLEYVSRADLWPLDPSGDLLLWCMIESRAGVENASEIAATPGVGGIFLGPSDLAMSLGVPEGSPKVEAAMVKVLDACRQANVPCGTLVGAGGVAMRLKQGFRFLAVGSDSGISGGVDRALRIGRSK